MNSLSVSVAIATYNGEAYLSEQLERLAQQGDPIDKLVISDDCSTGNVARWISRYRIQSIYVIDYRDYIWAGTSWYRSAVQHCGRSVVTIVISSLCTKGAMDEEEN
jgi:glycosyltransferase involved in cell wall biosynthesis